MIPKIVVIGSANTDMVIQVDHLPAALGGIVLCMSQLQLSARAYAQHNVIASLNCHARLLIWQAVMNPIHTSGGCAAISSEDHGGVSNDSYGCLRKVS